MLLWCAVVANATVGQLPGAFNVPRLIAYSPEPSPRTYTVCWPVVLSRQLVSAYSPVQRVTPVGLTTSTVGRKSPDSVTTRTRRRIPGCPPTRKHGIAPSATVCGLGRPSVLIVGQPTGLMTRWIDSACSPATRMS